MKIPKVAECRYCMLETLVLVGLNYGKDHSNKIDLPMFWLLNALIKLILSVKPCISHFLLAVGWGEGPGALTAPVTATMVGVGNIKKTRLLCSDIFKGNPIW